MSADMEAAIAEDPVVGWHRYSAHGILRNDFRETARDSTYGYLCRWWQYGPCHLWWLKMDSVPPTSPW